MGVGLRDINYCVSNKQQGYIVQHREIKPLFYNNFKWSIIYKNPESLCCILENSYCKSTILQ